jgi:hypothetical protein
MPPTRWDALLFARAAGMAAVALAVAWLVTAATDEGGVPWLGRVARTLPLAPLCSAVGAWAALAPVLLRGEALALQSLGRSPAQVGAAAVAGAALVAVLVAAAVGTSHALDVTGFYPLVTHASAWRWQGGSFVDPGRGLRVLGDGALERTDALVGSADFPAVPRFGRVAAAAAMACAGTALPMLVAQTLLGAGDARPAEGTSGLGPRRRVWAVAASAAAVVGSVLLFQAAAARRLPAPAGVLPPLVLLGYAVRRYRREETGA